MENTTYACLETFCHLQICCMISRGLTVNFQHNLVEVDHAKGEATFAKVGLDPVETVTMSVSHLLLPFY